MYGKVIFKILETIGNIAVDQATIWEAILAAGYGASHGKIQREVRHIEQRRLIDKTRWNNEKRRYYNSLAYLKREGLIESSSQTERGMLRLTRTGLVKLDHLRKHFKNQIAKKSYSLDAQPKQLVIVAFDITERDRHKRDWLRETLRNMGLTMIQRSVWFGKRKLPEEFIRDIQMLDLAECVEIFSISQAGSLRRLS